jgi:hypothetical protein
VARHSQEHSWNCIFIGGGDSRLEGAVRFLAMVGTAQEDKQCLMLCSVVEAG